jgi:hypothetical protein
MAGDLLSDKLFTPLMESAIEVVGGPGSTCGKWLPSTSPDSIKTQLSAPNWWAQGVYILSRARCGRKDLILSAADKDGALI